MMSNSTPFFQPSCPSGGDWYVCGNATNFVGCCTTYPCTNAGCVYRNLRPASFLASAYGNFPDQECSAGAWYSCKNTKPTFLGCCTSNACAQNGCSASGLRAGVLSENPDVAQKYDPQPPLDTSATSSTSSTSSSSATPTSTDSNVLIPGFHAQSPAVIAGGVAGGLITLLILVSIIGVLVRKHKQQQQAQKPANRIAKETISLPSQTEQISQHNETTEVPIFISEPVHAASAAATSTAPSEYPVARDIHEAESRELPYTPYSPYGRSPYSSGWRTGTMSHGNSLLGGGVNSMSTAGNAVYVRPEYAPAELT